MTTPQHIREAARRRPETEIEISLDNASVVCVHRAAVQARNLASMATHARLWGSATTGMTTSEIMALAHG